MSRCTSPARVVVLKVLLENVQFRHEIDNGNHDYHSESQANIRKDPMLNDGKIRKRCHRIVHGSMSQGSDPGAPAFRSRAWN